MRSVRGLERGDRSTRRGTLFGWEQVQAPGRS